MLTYGVVSSEMTASRACLLAQEAPIFPTHIIGRNLHSHHVGDSLHSQTAFKECGSCPALDCVRECGFYPPSQVITGFPGCAGFTRGKRLCAACAALWLAGNLVVRRQRVSQALPKGSPYNNGISC